MSGRRCSELLHYTGRVRLDKRRLLGSGVRDPSSKWTGSNASAGSRLADREVRSHWVSHGENGELCPTSTGGSLTAGWDLMAVADGRYEFGFDGDIEG